MPFSALAGPPTVTHSSTAGTVASTASTVTFTSRTVVSTATSTTSSSAPSATSSTAFNTTFAYGTNPVRGVNLGGWFVLEPWITPSIFQNTNNTAIVDEYTFGQMLDADAAVAILQEHWQTWITEQDFADIAAAGLNHVRIPLGYWSVPLTSADTNQSTSVAPYTPGAWPYFLQALTWARNNSVHVVVDLHGAPGSQNGYDNSGQHTNSPAWAASPANISRTLDTIAFLARTVGALVDVIELLNEPAAFTSAAFADTLRQYWSDGYGAVRAQDDGVKVMIGNGFLPLTTWSDFLIYPGSQGVFMDYHEYQIFSDDQLSRSLAEHITFACQISTTLSSFASHNLYTIMGEWSNAPTDCAIWLNGRGVGALWDGTKGGGQAHGACANWTGSAAGFSAGYRTFLGQYWQAQVEAAEAVQGWIFWTWKAENADEWSYQAGLAGGWIPQDPANRTYPTICTNT